MRVARMSDSLRWKDGCVSISCFMGMMSGAWLKHCTSRPTSMGSAEDKKNCLSTYLGVWWPAILIGAFNTCKRGQYLCAAISHTATHARTHSHSFHIRTFCVLSVLFIIIVARYNYWRCWFNVCDLMKLNEMFIQCFLCSLFFSIFFFLWTFLWMNVDTNLQTWISVTRSVSGTGTDSG